MIKKVLGGFGTVAGASYPFKALVVFQQNPQLWGYIAIPILVNIVVAIALYSSLLLFGLEFITDIQIDISNWFNQLLETLPSWLSILSYGFSGIMFLLRLLLTIVLLIIIGFILTQFGVLLGAPWYGQLSEKLEKIRTGRVEIIEVSIFRDIGRAILYEVKKLVLMAFVAIPLLILEFIPGVGAIIVTGGWFALTTTIICLDFLDSSLERRRLKFRKKLSLVFKHLPASASFAVVCFFLISIPLLNLFTIPLCVASGTLFVCDRVLPKL